MAKIITTDGMNPAEFPASGTHVIFTKADAPGISGLYVMDSTGMVVGPLSPGGGTPSGPAGPTVLTGTYPDPGLGIGVVGPVNIAPLAVTTAALADNSVTNLKMADNAINTLELVDDAVQTAKLANLAVTSGKIANGAVTSAKLAMTASPYAFILSDSLGGPWVGGLPLRIKFVAPARISILGDLGTVTDPAFPRLVNSSGPDIDLGYLSKTMSYEIKIGLDLNTLVEVPTVFRADIGVSQNVTLPDCRKYPVGTEITFVHTGGGSSSPILTISLAGTVGGGFADIVGESPSIPAVTQILLPGQTKKFVTFGAGWWVSREVFSRIKNLSLASAVSEAVPSTGIAYWAFNPAGSPPWQPHTPQRLLLFPVDLPDGALLTGVDILLEQIGAIPVTRMKVYLFREDVNYGAPAAFPNVVASVSALGNLLIQKVSLTGLAEFIYSGGGGVGTQSSWTVGVESSTGVPVPTQNAVYGVRLIYTL